MKDKTGRELRVSQCVDVYCEGMLTAYVTSISEGGLVGSNGKPEPATLVLQIAIPMKLNPGAAAPVYITRESDAPKSVASDEKSDKNDRKVM